MGGGLGSRCVGHVYGADGAVHGCKATWAQFSIQYRSKEISTTMGQLLDPQSQ